MGENKAIIDLGDWSKPVTTLIEKIASAVGILYEPKRIENRAKAEAKAEEINEINQLRITALKKRAIQRMINEESVKQENIENIIEKTIPLIQNTAKGENISNDWLSNFFEKSRLVSDDDMQTLWSKILAGEANNPGSFSKLTLKIISELEKKDAELFTNIASANFMIGGPTIVIFVQEDAMRSIYEKNYITFEKISHLDTLGLIQFNTMGYLKLKLPKQFTISYFNYPIRLEMQNESNNTLKTGDIFLTQAGRELITICGAMPNGELRQLALDKWKNEGIIIH
jgi:hypothetical protein